MRLNPGSSKPEHCMKPNLGTVDRVIRITVGSAMLLAGFFLHSYWGLIGLVPLATAAIGFCSAYCPLGIKACKDCGK